MARPRKIVDAEDLQRHIDAYFNSVDTSKDYYTWPDLLLFLNVTQTTVDKWLTDSDTYPGFADIIKFAQLKLQSQMEKIGLVDGKKTGMIAFMLKQKHYGGYTDKPISAADSINVNVNLQGMGHKDAFG